MKSSLVCDFVMIVYKWNDINTASKRNTIGMQEFISFNISYS